VGQIKASIEQGYNMRITEISVTKLFGVFDHTIPLNLDDRITIIHSENGFGKTTLLKMLHGLLNERYSELLNVPFEKFQVSFDDNSVLWAEREDPESSYRQSDLFVAIDRETLKLDDAKMITAVKDISTKHDLDEEDLLKSMRELANPNHDSWNVCCGHDLVCILSIGFRRALGRQKDIDLKIGLQHVTPELLERFLRSAYETTYFSDTQLYKSLRAWEKANPPYQVFPTS
jgi:hypothetical protein